MQTTSTSEHPATDAVLDMAEFRAAPLTLPARIGELRIDRLIGTSAGGYTYRGQYPGSDSHVIVQEYFPAQLAVRDRDGVSVLLRDSSVETGFEQGLIRFLALARVLTQIEQPARVTFYTEFNDTAYYVIDYEAQASLAKLFSAGKRLPEPIVSSLAHSVLITLDAAHGAGVIHQGLRPELIFLNSYQPPVIAGFNTVEAVAAGRGAPTAAEHALPWSAPEVGDDGAAAATIRADFYSLGAVLHQCISGHAPETAAERLRSIADGVGDPLTPATVLGHRRYPGTLLRAIDWMLELEPGRRPADAESVFAVLNTRPEAATDEVPESFESQDLPEGAALLRQDSDQALADSGPAHSANETDFILGSPAPLAETGPSPRPAWLPDGLLGNPYSWAVAILAVFTAAYLWLGTDNRPAPVKPAEQTEPLAASAPRPASPLESPPPRDDTTESSPATTQVAPDLTPRTRVDVPALPAAGPATAAAGSTSAADAAAAPITRADDAQRADRFRSLVELTKAIEPHLEAARSHFRAGRLLGEGTDNALAEYRAVLALDPGNESATKGIQRIADTLYDEASAALAEEDLDTVHALIPDLEALGTEPSRIELLRDRIVRIEEQREQERQRALAEERARQEALARGAEAERRLARARAALDSGRLVEPPDDNALAFYRSVLEIDPENPAARAGIESISQHFVQLAKQALASNAFDAADRNLIIAAAVMPDNPSIVELRGQLARLEALAEQEQQARREAELKEAEAEAAARQQVALNLESGISAYYRGAYSEAFSFLMPLARKDVARAQFRVAMMYQHGRGVERDEGQARRWFLAALEEIRRLAEAGEAWAQSDMGSYYEDGVVLARDYEEAARWYQLAADQGYPGAQTNLGVLYANGHGVAPDMQKAIEWFRRSAEQGDVIARENLRILGVDPARAESADAGSKLQ